MAVGRRGRSHVRLRCCPRFQATGVSLISGALSVATGLSRRVRRGRCDKGLGKLSRRLLRSLLVSFCVGRRRRRSGKGELERLSGKPNNSSQDFLGVSDVIDNGS